MVSLPIKREEMMINSEKCKLLNEYYQSHILFQQKLSVNILGFSSSLFEVFRCKANKSINLRHQLI